MKKIIFITPIILFILYAILPLGSLAALLMNYSFSLRNYTISAIITAIFSILAILTAQIDKTKKTTKQNHIFILLLLPMSLINWLFYILLSNWNFMTLCMAICSICALIYTKKYIQQKIPKIILSIICILIFIPLCLFSVMDYLFHDFGSNTITQTLYSLDGNYKAEVISSDQGIFGGNTFVDIYDIPSELDLYILKISKIPQRIYNGNWDEYKTIKIYWTDNHTLSINGTLYPINFTN